MAEANGGDVLDGTIQELQDLVASFNTRGGTCGSYATVNTAGPSQPTGPCPNETNLHQATQVRVTDPVDMEDVLDDDELPFRTTPLPITRHESDTDFTDHTDEQNDVESGVSSNVQTRPSSRSSVVVIFISNKPRRIHFIWILSPRQQTEGISAFKPDDGGGRINFIWVHWRREPSQCDRSQWSHQSKYSLQPDDGSEQRY